MKTGKRVAGKDIPLEDFKKIILEVFEKNLGFVNKTCEQLDMSRYTFNNYIKKTGFLVSQHYALTSFSIASLPL